VFKWRGFKTDWTRTGCHPLLRHIRREGGFEGNGVVGGEFFGGEVFLGELGGGIFGDGGAAPCGGVVEAGLGEEGVELLEEHSLVLDDEVGGGF
jgi:hypothetical protein